MQFSKEVSGKTMEKAVLLARYFLSHAEKTYRYIGSNNDNNQVQKTLDWAKKNRKECFTAREVQQTRVVEKATQVRDLFEQMQDEGLGIFSKDAKTFVLFETL